VKRLLCEGGGEVNGALFKAGLVDEVHLTMCPLIFGGRDAPTLADGAGVEHLAQAARLRLVSMKRYDDGSFLVYRRAC
jgi:2,5-diamino-6-(ribosylamino)-4(3H)-pyrimidinone 5'-phosphate reductase